MISFLFQLAVSVWTLCAILFFTLLHIISRRFLFLQISALYCIAFEKADCTIFNV